MLAAVARALAGGTPRGASRWETLTRCDREYFHRYVEGIELTKGRPGARNANGGGFEGGTLLDATLAAYYEMKRVAGGKAPGVDAIRPHFEEILPHVGAEGADVRTETVVWRTFERYAAWELEAYRHWRVVAVQVPLEAVWEKGDRDVRLTAKVDLLVQDQRDMTTIAVDNKISTAERGSVESSYRMAPAVVTTLLCARDGFVHDGNGWPGMSEGAVLDPGGADGVTPGEAVRIHHVWINQILTRESPPPARGASILVAQHVLDAYGGQVIETDTEAALHSDTIDSWPQRGLVSGACRGWGPCEYVDLCAGGPRARGLYRKKV